MTLVASKWDVNEVETKVLLKHSKAFSIERYTPRTRSGSHHSLVTDAHDPSVVAMSTSARCVTFQMRDEESLFD